MNQNVPEVIAATDGSAINNPHGPGGWAWFVSEKNWAAGAFTRASNQHAELFAILALLRAVPAMYGLRVQSDSQYAIDCITKHMPRWIRNDWRTASGGEVANQNVLRPIAYALGARRTTIRLEKVKGHSGNPMNEVADRLCSAASRAQHTGDVVVTGPGWTDYDPNPVIPAVGPRRSSPGPSRTRPAPPRATHPRPTRAPLIIDKQDPVRSRPQMCTACQGPTNPLTFECRCSN